MLENVLKSIMYVCEWVGEWVIVCVFMNVGNIVTLEVFLFLRYHYFKNIFVSDTQYFTESCTLE